MCRGANNVVEMRVGLSFISAENAQRNMETMVNGRTFDQVLADTTQHWVEQLSPIQVSATAPPCTGASLHRR